MDGYEFNEQENEVFRGLATEFKRFGGLWLFAGVALISQFIGWTIGLGFHILYLPLLTMGLFSLVVGVQLIRPSDNLQRVADTEGNDIKEVMTAVNELGGGFKLLNILYVINFIISGIPLFVM